MKPDGQELSHLVNKEIKDQQTKDRIVIYYCVFCFCFCFAWINDISGTISPHDESQSVSYHQEVIIHVKLDTLFFFRKEMYIWDQV